MSQIFVAGPAEIHCGVGSNGSLAFLGWSETGVRISDSPEWDDVPADISGSRVPADVQYMSSQAFVSLDLKVWNMNVYNAIAARYLPQSGLTRGLMPFGSIGALMLGQGSAYRLLVYPPYSQEAAMAPIRPYNFFSAWLAGPDDVHPFGTKAMKIRCIFRSIPRYDVVTGSFSLYNDNSAGRPVVS